MQTPSEALILVVCAPLDLEKLGLEILPRVCYLAWYTGVYSAWCLCRCSNCCYIVLCCVVLFRVLNDMDKTDPAP